MSFTARLSCDMESECDKPVTHIDAKGFVYCTRHGIERKIYQRCRQLTSKEKRILETGKPLASYETGRVAIKETP